MKAKTKHKLYIAWAYADHLDKSTEWMFQYMSDYAGVEYDVAVDFVVASISEKRSQWYKENPEWLNEMFETNDNKLKKK